jgi:hypothetical protein
LLEAAPAHGGDDAELGQLAAHAVHQLRPLLHQQHPRAFQTARGLLLDALDRDKAHVRTAQRGADRRGIARIILVALHEGLHVSRRDQAYIMAQRTQRARPVMRRAAGLEPDQARRLLAEELLNLTTAQLLLNDDLAVGVFSMNLEH